MCHFAVHLKLTQYRKLTLIFLKRHSRTVGSSRQVNKQLQWMVMKVMTVSCTAIPEALWRDVQPHLWDQKRHLGKADSRLQT